MAQGILGSSDLAWDAVQETLLRIWVRGWLPPDPRGALASLVRASSLHQRRCLARRAFHEAHVDRLHETCCEEDPLHSLVRDEQAREVREVIVGLSSEFRRVFELCELEGHPYDQVAEQLGIPIGTVRSRLSRARRWVRDRLPEGEGFV